MKSESSDTRPLTPEETRLLRRMLEHGTAEGPSFLCQLEFAQVTSWRCPCGCASFNLAVNADAPPVQAHSYVVADFLFGPEDQPSGIFAFQKDGRLAGIDVYGLAADAPKTLPRFEDLRPWNDEPQRSSDPTGA